ncbi:trypsin-like serine protease [Nannocystis sp.]|uniref:S1 family peptidase n=1 Tax=Nannocystis sp. TaxID=1962667 RepID=UPI0025D04D65|nr:trypsin-like serine protease [Nannocystis sp.]MBK7828307.1 trypsin-like serine protease [Nannocystis sp.]
MTPLRLTLSVAVAGLVATPARAGDPQGLRATPTDPQTIYGGTEVALCGWPTTVSMEGSCTGTLVHPQVVIYAQHCGTGFSQIGFGENVDQPKRTVFTEFCKTYPNGGPGTGSDFAFCKLSEPVQDVPIVPVLMGCETDLLQPGQTVTIVGFGEADNGPYGLKREVTTTITGFDGQEILIGGGGKDSCYGDSGGPVFLQVADGTWRVFGITSYGQNCGEGGVYSMMHNGMQWFEQETGLDLTPCHDADGTWAPSFDCQEFPSTPAAGGRTWPDGCSGGPVGAYSATCGAAFDPTPDTTPPTVTIVAPMAGEEFMGMGNVQVTVTIDAQDDGWGMESVQLLVNDKPVPGGLAKFKPYEFKPSFPTGGYCIGATGLDRAGNIGEATPVCIGVNKPAPTPDPPEPESTGDASGGETDPTGDTPTTDGGGSNTNASASDTDASASNTDAGGSDTGLGQKDSDEGCGCRSGHVPGDSLLALAGLALLARPRRRRA